MPEPWQQDYRNKLMKMGAEELFDTMLEANAPTQVWEVSSYGAWRADESAQQVCDRLLTLEAEKEDVAVDNDALQDTIATLLDKIEILEEELASQ